MEWVKSIAGTPDVAKQVEKGKSQFAGHEILGKSLGVIGLGAVGGPFANAARKLGMQVYGCDPFISIDAAWHLDSQIHRVNSREEVFANCDFISLHTPLLEDTKKMINAETIAKMKDGVVILNFARDLLVDDEAMAAALASGKVKRYITDFPNDRTAKMPGCIAIPHLGASTEESEDNCAKMAVSQVMKTATLSIPSISPTAIWACAPVRGGSPSCIRTSPIPWAGSPLPLQGRMSTLQA